MKIMLPLCVVLLMTTALAQSAPVEERIMAMYESRLQKFQSASTPEAMADAYVADIVDDAVWLPQGGPPVRGKQAVRAWAVDFFATWVLEINDMESEPINVSDQIAVRRFVADGVYEERGTGRRIPFSQNYVDVLELQPDGTWKLESHMWNSNDRLPSIWSEQKSE